MDNQNVDGIKIPSFMADGQTSRNYHDTETNNRKKYDNAKEKSLNGRKRASKKSKKKVKNNKRAKAMATFFIVAMIVAKVMSFTAEQFNEYIAENEKISTITKLYENIVQEHKEYHYKIDGNIRVPVFNDDGTQEYGYDISGIINDTLKAIDEGGNEIVAITTIGNVMDEVGAKNFDSVVKGVTGAENYSEWLEKNGFIDDKEAEKAKNDIALGIATNNEAKNRSELDTMLNDANMKNTTGAITDANVK